MGLEDETRRQVLLVRNSGDIRWLVLNRPASYNALDTRLVDELTNALLLADNDDDVRTVVLTGNGSSFCAGADLNDFLIFLSSKSEGPDFLDKTERLTRVLVSMSKPTIAALNGFTCAGGLEIALACDLVLAVESAVIGDGHAKYGAFPGGGGCSLLPRRIGMNRAKYLLYTGDLLPASVWKDWGVVLEVASNVTELTERVEEIGRKISQHSSLTMKEMKRTADKCEAESRDYGFREEMRVLRELCNSDDLREGLSAFQDKRIPRFTGA